jgi:hypothetical protein
MKNIGRAAIHLTLLAALGGCAVVNSPLDSKPVARQDLYNDQRHVIGYKEVSRDSVTGEELTRIALFVPRLDARGQVIGYEEPGRSDTILRDIRGKRVGARFIDLRSSAGNPGNKGLTILVYSKRADELAVSTMPSIEELTRLAKLDR